MTQKLVFASALPQKTRRLSGTPRAASALPHIFRLQFGPCLWQCPSFQPKNLGSLLAKTPTFESRSV
jgi:hypothetical protein